MRNSFPLTTADFHIRRILPTGWRRSSSPQKHSAGTSINVNASAGIHKTREQARDAFALTIKQTCSVQQNNVMCNSSFYIENNSLYPSGIYTGRAVLRLTISVCSRVLIKSDRCESQCLLKHVNRLYRKTNQCPWLIRMGRNPRKFACYSNKMHTSTIILYVWYIQHQSKIITIPSLRVIPKQQNWAVSYLYYCFDQESEPAINEENFPLRFRDSNSRLIALTH